jgi:hypothetical protein
MLSWAPVEAVNTTTPFSALPSSLTNWTQGFTVALVH